MTHDETLFDFARPGAARVFSPVDDRVMGGVSRSALHPLPGGALFAGHLSMEKGGGFASIRSEPARWDLSAKQGILLEVRGDGRPYKLRLRTDTARDSLSYQAPFCTPPGSSATVHLPFEDFQPTYRGRIQADAPPLDPARIRSFGLLIADGRAGPFRLELFRIGSYS